MSFGAVEMAHLCVHLQKVCCFFASHRASAVGNAARDSTSWGPAPRRLGPRSVGVGGRGGEGEEGRPDLSKHQHGRISSRCGVQSLTLKPPGEGKKRQNIYKCTPKCAISTAPKDMKTEF